MSNTARQLIGGTVPDDGDDAPGLQQLAEQSLLRLQSHTAGLDEVVRDEIRRSFIAECGALVEEAHLAAEALAHLRRCARRHFATFGMLTVLLSIGAVLLLVGGWLPSRSETARLRAEQAKLSSSIVRLSQLGGQVEMRRCGPQARLCVRVDVTAPRYGSAGDFYVLKGY
ncbi:MAG TPA: hypothetical protein VHY19_03195 [Steroidobacteraceae bacterium]|jgi:hypothetical protein|nr:hypothetical protein [Steroidobacteraceae bacterium]